MCVFKDTLYKDNLGKIWPKPTLFMLIHPSIRAIWEKKPEDIFSEISIKRLFFVKKGLHIFLENLWFSKKICGKIAKGQIDKTAFEFS